MTGDMKTARRDFDKGVLLEADVPSDPLELLRSWYQAAEEQGEVDANAMSLATLDADGYPVSRIVLMRGLTHAGITFFTNYQSAKGQQLKAYPKAQLQFFWKSVDKQVRVRERWHLSRHTKAMNISRHVPVRVNWVHGPRHKAL